MDILFDLVRTHSFSIAVVDIHLSFYYRCGVILLVA